MTDSERLLKLLHKANTEHGSLIISFDYDDTVSPHSANYWALAPVRGVLQRAKALGHKLILNTNNKDIKGCIAFCKKHGFVPDAINENIVDAFKGQTKVYANLYLDDKTLLFEAVKVLNVFLKETTED